jgi:hypothetical protein
LFIFSCLCLILSIFFSFYHTFSFLSFHYFFIYFIYLCSFPYSFLHFLLLSQFLSFFFYFLHRYLFLAENYSRLQSLNEDQYQALQVPGRGGVSVIRKIHPSIYSSIMSRVGWYARRKWRVLVRMIGFISTFVTLSLNHV